MPEDDQNPHQLGHQLLLDAFRAARQSGRSDWDRMTLAVLKNRILTLTDREFDEEAWGVSTFRDFVDLFPETVRVDRSMRPPMVELLPSAADETDLETVRSRGVLPPTRKSHWFVRPDLWRATLDYSSGDTYVWDGGAAIRLPAHEASEETRPILPTVSPEEMTSWRSEFADSISAQLAPELVAAVHRWRDESLTSVALPARLRGRWIEELKHHVQARLTSWFDASGLETPGDLVEMRETRTRVADETEQLRSLVLRCVRAMTRAELEELRLPTAVLLRASR